MPPQFSNVVQVVVKGKVQGQDYRNVLHFGTNRADFDADYAAILLALANAVIQCYVTVLLPGLSTDVAISGAEAKRIWPALTDSVQSDTAGGVGGAAGDSLPSFNSVKAELKTGAGGRQWRGRMYLPPPPETMTAASELTNAGSDLFVAFLTCIVGKFVGANATTEYRLGVLSRKAIAGGSNIGDAFRQVTGVTLTDNIAIMGRRKLQRGS